VGGDTDINNTFLQPFLSYTTKNAVNYTVNTESIYNWDNNQWTVLFNVLVGKVLTIGKQPVQIAGGVRYWAETPDNGPDDFALRLVGLPFSEITAGQGLWLQVRGISRVKTPFALRFS